MVGSQTGRTVVLAMVLLAVTQVSAAGHDSAPHDNPGHHHDDSPRHEAVHALEEGRASDEQLAMLGLRRDTVRCGRRMFVLADVPAGTPAACTHGPDTFAATPTATGTHPVDTPPGIPCFTTAGKRVKVIYAYEQGTTNRISKRGPLIREAVAITDRAVAQSAKRSGSSEQRVRWLMDANCRLKIHVYEVPSAYATPGGLATWLRSTGRLTRSQKALTFQEWPVSSYTCSGLAEMWLDERKSRTLNDNNVQPRDGMMTWVDAAGCLPDISYTHEGGALVAAHELMHTLGAVQMGAPRSDGGGHCTDEWDIMCYGAGTTTVCGGGEGLQGDRLFDCKHNDYYDPTPASGSYLANHWNTARSDWLTTAAPAAWDRLHRPRVQVLTPLGGSSTNLPVTLRARANGGAVKATFLVNGKTVGTDTTRTSLGGGWYEFSLTLGTAKARSIGLADGTTVPVVAKAVDSIGRPGQHKVSVTVTAPTVTLDAPVPDEWGSLSAATTWAASASAPQGRTMAKVQLLVNGKVVATDTAAPYGGDIVIPAQYWNQEVKLTTRATDSAGSQMDSSSRSVYLMEPTFEMDAPSVARVGMPYRAWLGGGAEPMLAKVQLARVTTGSSGNPVHTVVAEDTTEPFIPTWTVAPSALTDEGWFALIGFDAKGVEVYRSVAAYPTVHPDDPGSPTVSVSSPADLATVPRGSVPVVASIDLGRFAGPMCTSTLTSGCVHVYANVTGSLGWGELTYDATSGAWEGTADTTSAWQRGGFLSAEVQVYSSDWSDTATVGTGGPLVFLP